MPSDSSAIRRELLAYLPRDRAQAIASGDTIADPSQGAVLLADLSGFTPLTLAFTEHLGPRRGAEAATHHLNHIYEALVATIHAYGGSIIGFSGDGMMCWFAATGPGSVANATLVALEVATELQRAMRSLERISVADGSNVSIALKTVIAAGWVRRFVVGDPQVQLHDVVAGDVVDAVGVGEQHASRGENLVESVTLERVIDSLSASIRIDNWLRDEPSGLRFAAVTFPTQLNTLAVCKYSDERTILAGLSNDVLRQWILPQIYSRLVAGQALYLAELRPAVALFAKFGGIQFDDDVEAGAKLDHYICWVQKLLNDFGGALIQLTTGDKGSYLYACFGAPTAYDDSGQRAVHAALALQTSPDDLGFRLSTHVGVAMGRMRVGAYGGSQRKTYGVQGPATNLSARLMMTATDGEIVVDQPMAQVLGRTFVCASKGLAKLKGTSGPIELFRVTKAHFQPDRPDDRIEELYGRDDVLDRLADTLTRAENGEGALIRLEGQAGIGKTHLVQHFMLTGQMRGHVPLIVAAQRLNRDRSYAVVRELVRLLLTTYVDTTAEQLSNSVSAVGLQSIQEFLLRDLLDLPVQEFNVSVEAQFRQELLTSAIIELVRRRAQSERLVLIFDDAHWLDEASIEVITALARVAVYTPFVIVLVHRPGIEHASAFLQQLSMLDSHQLIELDELSFPAIGVLIASRLGAPLNDLGQTVIHRLTQGNPYFVQELVGSMAENGRLVRSHDEWTLSKPLVDRLRRADCLRIYGDDIELRSDASFSAVDLGLPDSIHAIVLARIDRLEDDVALTLKSASVLGRTFNGTLLARIRPMEIDRAVFQSHLQALESQGFIQLNSGSGEGDYSFRHSIIQETVYRTLLLVQQQTMHQRIAEQIEHAQPDAVEQLAFHYRHADLSVPHVRDKTLRYFEAAAARAQRESANETALNYYERALALDVRWPWLVQKARLVHVLGRRQDEENVIAQLAELPDVPPEQIASLQAQYFEATSQYELALNAIATAREIYRANGEYRGRLRCNLDRAMIARRQGEFDLAMEQYHDVLAETSNLEGYSLERADASYGLGVTLRAQGQYEKAHASFAQALITYRSFEDRRREADTLTMLGTLDWLRRRYQDAQVSFDQALNIRREIGDRAGQGSSLITKAQAIRAIGDYVQAERLFRQAIAILQEVRNRWSIVNAWNELGIIYMLVGDFREAAQALDFAFRACSEAGADALRVHILCNLGQVKRDSGLVGEAIETLKEAHRIALERHDVLSEAQCQSELAIAYFMLDDYEAAEQMATEAISIYRRINLEVMTTADLGTLAQVALRLGHNDRARTYVLTMLDILERCEAQGPDYPQRDYLVAANVLRRLGDIDRAFDSLQSAYDVLQEAAGRILNEEMRTKFLNQLWFNREILHQFVETDAIS